MWLNFLYCLFLINGVIAAECGRSLPKPGQTTRIVGGVDVGRYRYPWFASLIYRQTGAPTCAGSLITTRHIVTAAHCFFGLQNPPTSIYKVVLGAYNLCELDDSSEIFGIEKIQIHQNYSRDQQFYDIALITLSEAADAFMPICLPAKGSQRPRQGTVIGFGVTKSGNTKEPCTMRSVSVTVYQRKECLNPKYSRLTSADMGPGVFCAGKFNGGIDSCQGDSGGPLQYYRGNKYFLLGIVSFGYGCAQRKLPGIYTDVPRYINWIKGKLY